MQRLVPETASRATISSIHFATGGLTAACGRTLVAGRVSVHRSFARLSARRGGKRVDDEDGVSGQVGATPASNRFSKPSPMNLYQSSLVDDADDFDHDAAPSAASTAKQSTKHADADGSSNARAGSSGSSGARSGRSGRGSVSAAEPPPPQEDPEVERMLKQYASATSSRRDDGDDEEQEEDDGSRLWAERGQSGSSRAGGRARGRARSAAGPAGMGFDVSDSDSGSGSDSGHGAYAGAGAGAGAGARHGHAGLDADSGAGAGGGRPGAGRRARRRTDEPDSGRVGSGPGRPLQLGGSQTAIDGHGRAVRGPAAGRTRHIEALDGQDGGDGAVSASGASDDDGRGGRVQRRRSPWSTTGNNGRDSGRAGRDRRGAAVPGSDHDDEEEEEGPSRPGALLEDSDEEEGRLGAIEDSLDEYRDVREQMREELQDLDDQAQALAEQIKSATTPRQLAKLQAAQKSLSQRSNDLREELELLTVLMQEAKQALRNAEGGDGGAGSGGLGRLLGRGGDDEEDSDDEEGEDQGQSYLGSRAVATSLPPSSNSAVPTSSASDASRGRDRGGRSHLARRAAIAGPSTSADAAGEDDDSDAIDVVQPGAGSSAGAAGSGRGSAASTSRPRSIDVTDGAGSAVPRVIDNGHGPAAAVAGPGSGDGRVAADLAVAGPGGSSASALATAGGGAVTQAEVTACVAVLGGRLLSSAATGDLVPWSGILPSLRLDDDTLHRISVIADGDPRVELAIRRATLDARQRQAEDNTRARGIRVASLGAMVTKDLAMLQRAAEAAGGSLLGPGTGAGPGPGAGHGAVLLGQDGGMASSRQDGLTASEATMAALTTGGTATTSTAPPSLPALFAPAAASPADTAALLRTAALQVASLPGGTGLLSRAAALAADNAAAATAAGSEDAVAGSVGLGSGAATPQPSQSSLASTILSSVTRAQASKASQPMHPNALSSGMTPAPDLHGIRAQALLLQASYLLASTAGLGSMGGGAGGDGASTENALSSRGAGHVGASDGGQLASIASALGLDLTSLQADLTARREAARTRAVRQAKAARRERLALQGMVLSDSDDEEGEGGLDGYGRDSSGLRGPKTRPSPSARPFGLGAGGEDEFGSFEDEEWLVGDDPDADLGDDAEDRLGRHYGLGGGGGSGTGTGTGGGAGVGGGQQDWDSDEEDVEALFRGISIPDGLLLPAWSKGSASKGASGSGARQATIGQGKASLPGGPLGNMMRRARDGQGFLPQVSGQGRGTELLSAGTGAAAGDGGEADGAGGAGSTAGRVGSLVGRLPEPVARRQAAMAEARARSELAFAQRLLVRAIVANAARAEGGQGLLGPWHGMRSGSGSDLATGAHGTGDLSSSLQQAGDQLQSLAGRKGGSSNLPALPTTGSALARPSAQAAARPPAPLDRSEAAELAVKLGYPARDVKGSALVASPVALEAIRRFRKLMLGRHPAVLQALRKRKAELQEALSNAPDAEAMVQLLLKDVEEEDAMWGEGQLLDSKKAAQLAKAGHLDGGAGGGGAVITAPGPRPNTATVLDSDHPLSGLPLKVSRLPEGYKSWADLAGQQAVNPKRAKMAQAALQREQQAKLDAIIRAPRPATGIVDAPTSRQARVGANVRQVLSGLLCDRGLLRDAGLFPLGLPIEVAEVSLTPNLRTAYVRWGLPALAKPVASAGHAAVPSVLAAGAVLRVPGLDGANGGAGNGRGPNGSGTRSSNGSFLFSELLGRAHGLTLGMSPRALQSAGLQAAPSHFREAAAGKASNGAGTGAARLGYDGTLLAGAAAGGGPLSVPHSGPTYQMDDSGHAASSAAFLSQVLESRTNRLEGYERAHRKPRRQDRFIDGVDTQGPGAQLGDQALAGAPEALDLVRQASEALERNAGVLRRALAARLGLRFTPQLEFHRYLGPRTKPWGQGDKAAARAAAKGTGKDGKGGDGDEHRQAGKAGKAGKASARASNTSFAFDDEGEAAVRAGLSTVRAAAPPGGRMALDRGRAGTSRVVSSRMA